MSDSSLPLKTPSHEVSDHQYGVDASHCYDIEAVQDHDADFPLDDATQEAMWRHDNVMMHSNGIDEGSWGTQVVFSRLYLRRITEDLSSRYAVVERTPIYQSPVSLTPYRSETDINGPALGKIIDQAYQDSGLHPNEIDAGAVIPTGEALHRKNSESIAAVLAEQGGEFVCATGGHHMESMLDTTSSCDWRWTAAMSSDMERSWVCTHGHMGYTMGTAILAQSRVRMPVGNQVPNGFRAQGVAVRAHPFIEQFGQLRFQRDGDTFRGNFFELNGVTPHLACRSQC